MTTPGPTLSPHHAREPQATNLRRFVAALIDVVLSLVVPVSYLINQMTLRELATSGDAARRCNFINDLTDDFCFHSGTQTLTGTNIMLQTALLLWVLWIVVHHALVSGLTGWTFGKLLTGLRVVNARTFRRAGLFANLIRTVLLTVDALPYGLPLVGPLLVLTRTRHQRLGDLAARTRIVRAADLEPSVRRRRKAAAQPSTAPVSTSTIPGLEAPHWDEHRNTYIQWDPVLSAWMQWSVDRQQWVPISH